MGVPLLSGISRFVEVDDKLFTKDIYISNNISLGSSDSKISLFGNSLVSRQSASDLTGVVSALRIYGFIK